MRPTLYELNATVRQYGSIAERMEGWGWGWRDDCWNPPARMGPRTYKTLSEVIHAELEALKFYE